MELHAKVQGCSRCLKDRDRPGQAYCRECHNAYMRRWRRGNDARLFMRMMLRAGIEVDFDPDDEGVVVVEKDCFFARFSFTKEGKLTGLKIREW